MLRSNKYYEEKAVQGSEIGGEKKKMSNTSSCLGAEGCSKQRKWQVQRSRGRQAFGGSKSNKEADVAEAERGQVGGESVRQRGTWEHWEA